VRLLGHLAINKGKHWLTSLFLLGTMLCVAALLLGVVSLGVEIGSNDVVLYERGTKTPDQAAGYLSLSYRFEAHRFNEIWNASFANRVVILALPALCLVLPTLTPLLAVFVVPFVGMLILVAQRLGIATGFDSTGLTIVLSFILIAYFFSYIIRRVLTRRKVDLFFRQYVPTQLSNHYMRNPDEIGLGGELRDITIMFCDIKRFTAISETMDPDLLPQWLNRFFDVVSDIIVKHNGTIDKYIGDSVMAIWGAPGRDDKHASNGLLAALEILEAVRELSKKFKDAGYPEIEVGIGVSTGKAHVGHLGSPHRISYTAVGDAVNMADRLEQCTGFYDLPLIVNDGTMEAVGDFLFRELDTVHVRGRQRFIRIYQPICHQQEASPGIHRQLQQHRKAMQFYRRGMWHDAESLFRKLSAESGESEFYAMYIKRLVDIRQSQLHGDGTHVVDFTQKIG